MSEEYGEFSGITTIDTSRLEGVSVDPEYEFVHLDDIDEPEVTKQVRIYVYGDEDRDDELAETVKELRRNYVFAFGIVWPAWLRDEMPLETDVLLALEWILAYGEDLTPDRLASVQNELCQEDST